MLTFGSGQTEIFSQYACAVVHWKWIFFLEDTLKFAINVIAYYLNFNLNVRDFIWLTRGFVHYALSVSIHNTSSQNNC